MSRTIERIIDLVALTLLLIFTYLFRESQPALAGLVVGAAIQFWMAKNASSPESQVHRENLAAIEAATVATQVSSAATAAAEILKTAEKVIRDRELEKLAREPVVSTVHTATIEAETAIVNAPNIPNQVEVK